MQQAYIDPMMETWFILIVCAGWMGYLIYHIIKYDKNDVWNPQKSQEKLFVNWSRIIKYCIILFIGTAAASFPFGLLHGLLSNRGYADVDWILFGARVSPLFAAIFIFARLAYIQRAEQIYHASLVGFFCWLVSFPINVLLLNQPVLKEAENIVVIFVPAFIGIDVGNLLFSRSASKNIIT
jgi:high-affinity Fe2+/Pb2+ permease